VSSAGAMYRTLRGSTAAKNAPPAPVHAPSAFSAKKSGFAPPPVRRVSADPVQVPEPEPEPEFQPEGGEEEEAAGQWAEALYDYTSEVRLPSFFSFT
jgi:abl interactor 2